MNAMDSQIQDPSQQHKNGIDIGGDNIPSESDQNWRKIWITTEALESYIVPSRTEKNPILPNFFVESWPNCSHYCVGMRHSLYIGCMGARAMQVLQSYGKPDPIFDGNAYTIVVTQCDGYLKFYSLHPTKSVESGSPVQYHMTCLASFAIVSVETLQAAVTAYRNLRDWTKEKRDEFIATANERVRLTLLSPIKTSAETGVSGSAWLIYAIGHRWFSLKSL